MEVEPAAAQSGTLFGRIGEEYSGILDRSAYFERALEEADVMTNIGILEALSTPSDDSGVLWADDLEWHDVDPSGLRDSIGGVGRGRSSGGSGDGRVRGVGEIGTNREREANAHMAPRGHVTLGDAEVSGPLSQEQVERVVRRYYNQIRYCYERALQDDHSLEGQIVANWTIDLHGYVAQASIETNTVGNQEIASCLHRSIFRMVFEQPAGGVVVLVRFPFTFEFDGVEE